GTCTGIGACVQGGSGQGGSADASLGPAPSPPSAAASSSGGPPPPSDRPVPPPRPPWTTGASLIPTKLTAAPTNSSEEAISIPRWNDWVEAVRAARRTSDEVPDSGGFSGE